MDKQRIAILADFIDSLADEHFSMIHWQLRDPYREGVLEKDPYGPEPWQKPRPLLQAIENCNTICCIAGYTGLIFMEPPDEKLYGDTAQNARYLLDLTPEQADALFTPTVGNDPQATVHIPRIDAITRTRAVRMLRTFAQTSKVDWNQDCDCELCVIATASPPRPRGSPYPASATSAAIRF